MPSPSGSRMAAVPLYVGGHHDFETIEDEWWQQDYGMTPLEHLLSELGLNITVGQLGGLSELAWTGEEGYCTSFDGKILMNGLDAYTATFTGSGYTSILEASGDCVGLTAKAGQGRVILLGTSSPIFTAYEDSPAMMREITQYACRYTGLEYLGHERLYGGQPGPLPFGAGHDRWPGRPAARGFYRPV